MQITLRIPNLVQPKNLIIELDSVNAVKWSKGGPWNLNFHLSYIRNAQKCEPSILITHQILSANHVADAFAKQGLHRQSEFIAWI